MQVANAHNYYLQVAAELGLLGLIVFLWIVAMIILIGWKATRNYGLIPLGLLTGIIGFLLALLTQHALVQMEIQFLFWIPIALLTSYLVATPKILKSDSNLDKSLVQRNGESDSDGNSSFPDSAMSRFTSSPIRAFYLCLLFICSVYLYNYISPNKQKQDSL